MPTPRPILRQLSITTLSAVAVVLLYLHLIRPNDPAPFHRSAVARQMTRSVSLDFIDRPLRAALRSLFDQIGVPFDVDWTELSIFAVTPDTPITLRLRDVDGATALTMLLREAAGGDGSALTGTWGEREGRILIADPSALSDTVVRMYDVSDLLDEDAAFRRAMPNQQHTLLYPMRSVTVGWPSEKPRGESTEDLKQLLLNAVDISSWSDYGGSARMDFAMDRLVVAQTPANQAQIARILAALRLRDSAAIANASRHGSKP